MANSKNTLSVEDAKLTLHKWSRQERENVMTLRENDKLGPMAISNKTGIPIGQIKFWIYGSRGSKRSKKSANHNENSKKNYYRLKYDNWMDWKATCICSSLNKRDKMNDGKLGRFKPVEIREWIKDIDLVCPYCNETLDIDNFSADHIVPVSRGGTNKLTNLQQICKKCNSTKSSLLDSEYRDLLNLISTWEDKGVNLLGKLRYAGSYYIKK